MNWNHRIVALPCDFPDSGETFGIHEVYYEDGLPMSYTSEPIRIEADSLLDLMEMWDRIRKALDKPVLRPADFPAGDEL